MKKIFLTLILGAAMCSLIKAQQDPVYSMYMFNGLFINPAYAGSQEVVDLMAIYRAQWVGIQGAPNTANLSVNSPFRQEQYAAGLVISDDKLGISNTVTITPSFAYRLKVKPDFRLCFGIQASLGYYYQNNSLANTLVQNDAAFSRNQSLFVPNAGFGIYAYGKRYFLGLSAPHLLPSSLEGKVGIVPNENIAKMYNQYIFTAGYVIGKDPSVVKFRPTILVQWQQGLPHGIPQIDISPALLFVDRIWLGATYRSGGDVDYIGQAIIAFAQFKVTPQLQIGYSYDSEMSSLRHYTSGSHEIMLGYNFWYDKKRFVTPRYVSYF